MEKSSETLAGQAFLDVAVIGNGLRRCVQSQVRSPGDSPGHARKNLSPVIPSVFEEHVASPEERIAFLLKQGKMT